jgi:translation initiation factor 3 subunit B
MAGLSEEDLKILEEEELEKYPPIDRPELHAVVVVDNLPIVDRAKEKKLKDVLKKIFHLSGEIIDVTLFFNEEGKTEGYGFIEFVSPEHANKAVTTLDNYPLDKRHVLRVNHFNDFGIYSSISEEYEPTEIGAFEPTGNLYSWLQDVHGCDQYALRYQDNTEMFWNGQPGAPPKSIENRTKWTETYVQWSPKGTYLVTFHQRGIILWGGPEWTKIKRIRCEGANLVDFSPNERYIVVFSSSLAEMDANGKGNDPQGLSVWDVRTGEKKRGFIRKNKNWPAFKWSHDDKYFSRLSNGLIFVFETDTFGLVNKKPLKLHGPAFEHCWSPSDPYLSAFVPEHKNIPARVSLLHVKPKPGNQEGVGFKPIREQALFNVKGCRMHWQEEGKFLGVKIDRFKKGKKHEFTSFEFFRVREKGVPVESLELKEKVIAFAFEPKGNRLGIIHSESENAA